VTQQDGDLNPGHNVEKATNKGPGKEGDRLMAQVAPIIAAPVVSEATSPVTSLVTPERTFEDNAEQTSEAFVAWTPTKRVIRKHLFGPDGKPQTRVPKVEPTEVQDSQIASQQVSALMRVLGLAHYWQRLLHERRMTSVKEIAKAEGLSVAQVNRVLRLASLAPSIIEWLVGSNDIALEDIMNRPWPSCWATQLRSVFPTDKNSCAPWDQQGRLKAG
jgi:hypothetical protein